MGPRQGNRIVNRLDLEKTVTLIPVALVAAGLAAVGIMAAPAMRAQAQPVLGGP
jgi:hypothetical protein